MAEDLHSGRLCEPVCPPPPCPLSHRWRAGAKRSPRRRPAVTRKGDDGRSHRTQPETEKESADSRNSHTMRRAAGTAAGRELDRPRRARCARAGKTVMRRENARARARAEPVETTSRRGKSRACRRGRGRRRNGMPDEQGPTRRSSPDPPGPPGPVGWGPVCAARANPHRTRAPPSGHDDPASSAMCGARPASEAAHVGMDPPSRVSAEELVGAAS